MAKLKAHGREILRYSKEKPGDGDSTEWERTTTAYMSDGKVMEKLDVRFKPWREGEQPQSHSYGWKLKGKLKPGANLAVLRDKAAAAGYTIHVDFIPEQPEPATPAAPAIPPPEPGPVAPEGEKIAQSLFDLLKPRLKTENSYLSDEEAGMLYAMWKDAPPGSNVFPLPAGADKRMVMALKSKGMLSGYGEALEITDKGRKVIIEMVTNERNAFEKKSETISYNAIKQKAKNKSRTGLRKHAGKRSETKPFNLREESLKKMRGEK